MVDTCIFGLTRLVSVVLVVGLFLILANSSLRMLSASTRVLVSWRERSAVFMLVVIGSIMVASMVNTSVTMVMVVVRVMFLSRLLVLFWWLVRGLFMGFWSTSGCCFRCVFVCSARRAARL